MPQFALAVILCVVVLVGRNRPGALSGSVGASVEHRVVGMIVPAVHRLVLVRAARLDRGDRLDALLTGVEEDDPGRRRSAGVVPETLDEELRVAAPSAVTGLLV